MALKTAAETVKATQPGPRCRFGAIVKALSDDDRAYLQQMQDEGALGTHIAAVFQADGHDVSDFTVRRHLNGKCACR